MTDLKKIKQLRQTTGAGFKDCDAAIQEANGDLEKAIEVLRVKGISKASKKMSRDANEGVVAVSGDEKKLTLIEVNCETDFVAKTEDFQNMVRDIAMHIAASGPIAVNKEEVPADILETEKEIYADQARKSGKPEKILEKMVEGRISKFYQENVLMEQSFVKDPNITINELITSMVAKLGENIIIARFVRFQLGETAKKIQETEI